MSSWIQLWRAVLSKVHEPVVKVFCHINVFYKTSIPPSRPIKVRCNRGIAPDRSSNQGTSCFSFCLFCTSSRQNTIREASGP